MRKLRQARRRGRLDLAKHCFLHQGRYSDYLTTYYGREGALKVFDLNPIEKIEDIFDVKWGDDPVKKGDPRKNTTLLQATQIQNILAWHGLAPRIYALDACEINEQMFPLQLTEFIDWQEDQVMTQAQVNDFIEKCVAVGKEYGFGMDTNIASTSDVLNGKLVDPQFFHFMKPYRDTVIERYRNNKYGKKYYQDIPELDLNGGPRKSELRIKELGLDRIDFTGKKVADIGCAGGYFTRVAIDLGAQLADGFDLPVQIDSARNVANLLGYFNNNYYEVDLQKENWHIDYDIVFFLSLNYHIGIPQQILDAPMVVFEDNGQQSRHFTELGKPWTDHFSRITFIGKATDHGYKSIYHLYK